MVQKVTVEKQKLKLLRDAALKSKLANLLSLRKRVAFSSIFQIFDTQKLYKLQIRTLEDKNLKLEEEMKVINKKLNKLLGVEEEDKKTEEPKDDFF